MYGRFLLWSAFRPLLHSMQGRRSGGAMAGGAGTGSPVASKTGAATRHLFPPWAGRWSERADSNRRPLDPQSSALPGCATLRPARTPPGRAHYNARPRAGPTVGAGALQAPPTSPRPSPPRRGVEGEQTARRSERPAAHGVWETSATGPQARPARPRRRAARRGAKQAERAPGGPRSVGDERDRAAGPAGATAPARRKARSQASGASARQPTECGRRAGPGRRSGRRDRAGAP